ncbi:hypothetical protein KOW79_011090 [Hemibagrus wyckioides]|uniref:Uncharacterized protein n=1 Tax=Hemibagrus wyckioides TaxID=337641 RepID=A0A9D3NLY4_9TELE|nr:hypothetical protein KOW79_011090 [Hemibagrus wyckioides]
MGSCFLSPASVWTLKHFLHITCFVVQGRPALPEMMYKSWGSERRSSFLMDTAAGSHHLLFLLLLLFLSGLCV